MTATPSPTPGPAATPTPAPTPPALPGLRLPLGPRRLGPWATVTFLIHGLTIALLVLRGRELLERVPGGPGPRGGAAEVNFFALPAAGPTQVSLPAAPPLPPPVTVSDLQALEQVKLDVPEVELTQDRFAPPTIAPTAVTAVAAGAGRGSGAGLGTGAGVDPGPGTGGEGGYIVASPQRMIVPPMVNVPGSVAGRTHRVRFWVAADGHVTRVEVDPPIRDADYRRAFQQSMMAYRFSPARTRDGQSVASVVTVSLRIGN